MGEAGAGDPVKSNGVGGAFAGILVCIALNVAALFFWLFSSGKLPGAANIGIVALLGIGISQLAYVVPLVIWARKRAMNTFATGVIIGAAITFLLNGACWSWFLIAKPRIGG